MKRKPDLHILFDKPSVLERKKILALIVEKVMSSVDGAKHLGISSRHLRRLVSRYRSDGALGFEQQKKHNVGRIGYDEKFRQNVITLYKNKYMNLGPTAACIKLKEVDGIKISRETLRRWLLSDKEGM